MDEYQGGRSLEELQGYMDTQLAVINVNADRTDEKIPEKVQVEDEKPQEILVLSYWLIIRFDIIWNKVMWSKMHEIWKLLLVLVYSFTKQRVCKLFSLIEIHLVFTFIMVSVKYTFQYCLTINALCSMWFTGCHLWAGGWHLHSWHQWRIHFCQVLCTLVRFVRIVVALRFPLL